MDSMEFPHGAPAVGIIPLGTGNDLSRSLHWGAKYNADKPLRKVIMDLVNANVVYMDRWTLSVATSLKDHNPGVDVKLVCNLILLLPNCNIQIKLDMEGRGPETLFCLLS